jgi:alanine-glyoxylate transaminase / serine-glyoxylate transaminase / serine-pyruvate transaminase
MTRHYKLFIPGPVSVDEDVLDAMSQPVMRHYGDEWLEVYNETLDLAKQVFQTQGDLFIVPGPGSAAVDMGLGSLLATGDRIVVGINGFFGERLAAIAQSYGLEVVPFTAELGQPLAPDALREILREKDARAVAVVHHETATTVMNPVKLLAEVTHKAGLPILVDAISSLGGVDLPVDAWGIDVCGTATNKCLECPPGLALISISSRAWEQVDQVENRHHGWYLSLKTWRQYRANWGAWHPSPVTLPTNNIVGLRVSLRKIVAEGLEARFARFVRISRAVRKGLGNVGFEMFVPDEFASPLTTAVKARPEFPVSEMLRWLAEERGILVGGGLEQLAGKIFRVGHLGKASTREYLMDFLFSVEEFLRLKGMGVPVGASFVGL